MYYSQMTDSQLKEELERVRAQYKQKQGLKLKLDMSRGKPAPEQSALSKGILTVISEDSDCISREGIDCRNYGFPKGLIELKEIFAPIIGADPEQIIPCGNSSLNLMYDCVSDAYHFGFPESDKPWGKYERIKFICPCPGYDRHFFITQNLGAELIAVDMLPTGPDMDKVEELCKNDPTVKGIWCVPKYSNPDGYTYSDETVKRLASMECAAKDFKIFWDNAYCIHDLYDESDPLLNILEECKKANNPDRALVFFSTSKITYAGGGVAFVAGSPNTVKYFSDRFAIRVVCYDKLNQLRHARFFQTTEKVYEHMKKHAALLRPKFEMVCNTLSQELDQCGFAQWNKPRGGYFVSLNVMDHTAKRVFALCGEAGVTLTNVGATFPCGMDPRDRNIRISPSAVTEAELKQAMEILCISAKLAALEKLLSHR